LGLLPCHMGKPSLLADLHAAVPLVGPSLLACDFANLEREIGQLEDGGARILHLDVMDGHFVPNLSFGIPVVQAIRRVSKLPLDVHLMITHPETYVERFHEAGADLLTIHIETVPRPSPLLRRIRGLGMGVGIALAPPTPVAAVEPYLGECDLVLTMSVMPGFGGQQFEPSALEKLRVLREKAGPDVLLSVDGGVNAETIGLCSAAGAGLFIVGTALFEHSDYGHRLRELAALARDHRDV
jgi:ribulose-phosphate 3-epimerase